MKIFPNSAGWNENGPDLGPEASAVDLAPADGRDGTTGSSRSTTPIRPIVYV